MEYILSVGSDGSCTGGACRPSPCHAHWRVTRRRVPTSRPSSAAKSQYNPEIFAFPVLDGVLSNTIEEKSDGVR